MFIPSVLVTVRDVNKRKSRAKFISSAFLDELRGHIEMKYSVLLLLKCQSV